MVQIYRYAPPPASCRMPKSIEFPLGLNLYRPFLPIVAMPVDAVACALWRLGCLERRTSDRTDMLRGFVIRLRAVSGN